jgi:hypothetical protein
MGTLILRELPMSDDSYEEPIVTESQKRDDKRNNVLWGSRPERNLEQIKEYLQTLKLADKYGTMIDKFHPLVYALNLFTDQWLAEREVRSRRSFSHPEEEVEAIKRVPLFDTPEDLPL